MMNFQDILDLIRGKKEIRLGPSSTYIKKKVNKQLINEIKSKLSCCKLTESLYANLLAFPLN